MTKKAAKFHSSNIELYYRVLGYKTEDRWAAHCLETDIVGYGRTFESALKELIELTDMQVSFAIFKNQPSLLDHPAPLEIIEMYQTVYRAKMIHYYSLTKSDPTHTVTSIPYPRITKSPQFSLAQA